MHDAALTSLNVFIGNSQPKPHMTAHMCAILERLANAHRFRLACFSWNYLDKQQPSVDAACLCVCLAHSATLRTVHMDNWGGDVPTLFDACPALVDVSLSVHAVDVFGHVCQLLQPHVLPQLRYVSE